MQDETTKEQRYVKLCEIREILQRDLDIVEVELEKLESEIKEEWAKNGVSKMTVDGKTLHLRRNIWASMKPDLKAEALAMLEQNGLGDYVQKQCNTQSISSYVRGFENQDTGEIEGLPSWFADYFKISTVIKLGIRS